MAENNGAVQIAGSPHETLSGAYTRLAKLLGRPLDIEDRTLNVETRELMSATKFIFFKQRDWLRELFRKPHHKVTGPLSEDRKATLIKSIMSFKDNLKIDLAQQNTDDPGRRSLQSTPVQQPKLKDSQIDSYWTKTKSTQPSSIPQSTPPTSTEAPTKRGIDSVLIDDSVEAPLPKRQRPAVSDTVQNADTEPKNMTFKIRDMPFTGLGVTAVQGETSADMTLTWDRYRAYATFPKDVDTLKQVSTVADLKEAVDELNKSRGNLYDTRTIFDETAPINPRSRPYLSGELTFNNNWKNNNFFRFTPRPIKTDQANRVQLKYGWKRVLYLDVDLRETLPQHIQNEKPAIMKNFKEWLMTEHKLFSWRWRAFHLQKASEGRVRNGNFQWRVVLFAINDRYHREISLEELVLKVIIPAQLNAYQPACKAYSRIDLALSRIYRSITFKPEQIILVDDLRPTSTVYQDQFLDTDFACEHRETREYDSTEVMTDGCAMISVGAALLINEKLGIKSRPTAYQARIAGSKGMWHVSAGYDTTDPHDLNVWIHIRESQVKVRHHTGPHARAFSDDLDPLFAKDIGLLSFDVVRYSKVPSSATIHKDFLPVLEDRGVPREAIMALAEASLDAETDDMRQGTLETVSYARQVQRYMGPPGEISEDDSLPRDAGNRLWVLLHQGGFTPRSIRFVADEYLRLCAQSKLQGLQCIQIRCEESCTLLGVADPYGILQEGEVHIKLSGFQSGGFSNKDAVVNGKDVLIARDPTIRASDIQKFKAVDNAKLAHLVNVVVFSSKGSMPAAARLQGGDYDGDSFTVIWHAPFVSAFKNAPVLQSKSPTELGIGIDKTKLGAFLPDPQPDEEDLDIQTFHVDKFLRHAFAFKLQDNCLGLVTNSLYSWNYKTGDISSAGALDLIDLHDYLVDQAKNGYSFSQDDFEAFIKERKLKSCDQPAYQRAIKELETRLKTSYSERLEEDKKVLATVLITYEPRSKPKRGLSNIVDDLFFNVMFKSAKESLKELADELSTVPDHDPDLFSALKSYQELHPASRGALDSACRATILAIGKIMKNWPTQKGSFNPGIFQQMVADYRAVKMLTDTPGLHFRPAEHAFTLWERLRACILMQNFRLKQKAVLYLASDVLCAMKRESQNGRETIRKLLPYLKVKKPQVAMAQYLPLEPELDNALVPVDEDDYGIDVGMEDAMNELW